MGFHLMWSFVNSIIPKLYHSTIIKLYCAFIDFEEWKFLKKVFKLDNPHFWYQKIVTFSKTFLMTFLTCLKSHCLSSAILT